MTKDEHARARLVEIWEDLAPREKLIEIALHCAAGKPFSTTNDGYPVSSLTVPNEVRRRAGFKNPRTGSWCAAGLTAAMEDAGLVVPAPGTPARRGAVALLDFVIANTGDNDFLRVASGPGEQWRQVSAVLAGHDVQPGDIIAWLQYPPGKDPAGWRRGHVALIVAVDDVSITTVGWNEGNTPGRVMKRRLWRHTSRKCPNCEGIDPMTCPIQECKGGWITHPPSSTVLYRRPGGLYGIARPVAR